MKYRIHGYTYGHSLVRYVESAYGPQGVRQLVRNAGDIRAALSVDDGLFEQNWNGFLRREFLD